MKCIDCGFWLCELSYTSNDHPQCCQCFNNDTPTIGDHHECQPCEKRRVDKENILRHQTLLTQHL